MRTNACRVNKNSVAGELSLRWNQILPSLLNTSEKLKKLGYIISNGQVSIVEIEKEEKRV